MTDLSLEDLKKKFQSMFNQGDEITQELDKAFAVLEKKEVGVFAAKIQKENSSSKQLSK